MTTTTVAASPIISRLTLTAPFKQGLAPALASRSYAARATQLFETLNAHWTSWRGQPWSQAYSNVVAVVPGLHSLRLVVIVQPGTILLETSFEGDLAPYLKSLKSALGPLLDVIFCNCDGYAGTREQSDAEFAAWVMGARAGAGFPGGAPTCAVAELQYLRQVVRRCPVAGAGASSPESSEFALHALAELHRHSNLYITEGDSLTLQRAARSLLANLYSQVSSAPAVAGQPVQARFADAIGWLGGAAGSGQPTVFPAADALAANTIKVKGKKLVSKVFLDVDGNYSVSGYAERMRQSFGMIYLGLDKTDPEYARQSAVPNAAIGMISEREAFTRALEETRAALKPPSGSPTFDITDLSNTVLAALCTGWFDIPDGVNFVAGGQSFSLPARCPGHFAAPSGFIFQPTPALGIPWAGKMQGGWLHDAAAKFVTARRAPGNPPKGPLSKALFAAFPDSPAQDDLLARTLIGVMIGFLPTVQFNLIGTMKEWCQSKTFDQLKHEYMSKPEPDPYVRAGEVIRGPMMAMMQQLPVPPDVWRTAVKNHDLGDSPVVHVNAGDKISISIESATQEDLANNIADVTPIFGGDRSQNPHPTHACPGFWMGMGVLLGIIAGTMEAAPTLAPLTASSNSTIY